MKYNFIFTKRTYKTLEVDGELTELGVRYVSPYTEEVEKLQNDGWALESVMKV